MERTFKEALRHRRSYYALAPESPIDDARIEEIVRFAIKHVPSAFNSQSTRAVLLLHEHHDELWKIVKRTLRAIVPEGAFARTRGEDRAQLRSRVRHRTFLRGHGCRPQPATTVSGLCGEFPGMVGADVGHAPAGSLDDAGRRRVGGIAPTLQPANRR